MSELSEKRTDYVEWTDYFMAVALLSAQRSKDPATQVGACIVNKQKRIVGVGYNGMPNGCDDDSMPWNAGGDDLLNTKHLYVCHAEMNAILNKNSSDVEDCAMYVTLFPCFDCAQLIIQSGITQVFYMNDGEMEKREFQAAKKLLDTAHIKYSRFVAKRSEITIDFDVLDAQVNGLQKLCLSRSGTSNEKVEMSGEPVSSQYIVSNGHCRNRPTASSEKFLPEAMLLASAVSMKRTDYVRWPDYFMAVAFLSAQRSKDPATQVGACIVNKKKRIVGVGYNGMPNGCSDDVMPWNKDGDDWLKTKYPYVCHAEKNAILNKNSGDVEDCTMYVTLFPCNKCAQLIIQSGIRRVFYMSDKHNAKPEFKAARILLGKAGIECSQFIPSRSDITINYNYPRGQNQTADQATIPAVHN